MGRNATENERSEKSVDEKQDNIDHLRCLDFALLFLQSTPNI